MSNTTAERNMTQPIDNDGGQGVNRTPDTRIFRGIDDSGASPCANSEVDACECCEFIAYTPEDTLALAELARWFATHLVSDGDADQPTVAPDA